jgi:K+ transporter
MPKKKRKKKKKKIDPTTIMDISGNDPSTSSSLESSVSSVTEASEEHIIPEPAVFQVEMNDGAGHISQHNITTLPRVGVFLAYSKIRTPLVFEVFLDRISGIPQIVMFLKINKANIPFVKDEDRVRVRKFFDDFYFVDVSFGYAEHTKHSTLTDILAKHQEGLPDIRIKDVTLFVPADTIEVVNTNIFWNILLTFYATMKSVFFGAHRVKFPPEQTIYIATVASL